MACVKGEMEARTESERLAALPQTVDRLAGFRIVRLMLWEISSAFTYYLVLVTYHASAMCTCHCDLTQAFSKSL